MNETLIYWLMQKLGYRKIYFDWALENNMRLTSYECWLFRPKWQAGTYREQRDFYKFAGYGVDR